MQFIYPQTPVILGELASLLHGSPLEEWCNIWLGKASEAEGRGNQLIIVEIPKNEIPDFTVGQIVDDTLYKALSE